MRTFVPRILFASRTGAVFPLTDLPVSDHPVLLSEMEEQYAVDRPVRIDSFTERFRMVNSKHGKPDEVVEEIVRGRLARTGEDESPELYQDLLRIIWSWSVTTLHRVATRVVFERSLESTRESCPSLARLRVGDDGFQFQEFEKQTQGKGTQLTTECLKKLAVNLIGILITMTGDIVVRRLVQIAREGRDPEEISPV